MYCYGTWIANIFILSGLIFLGQKKRWAFILTAIGEVIWGYFGVWREDWPLAFIGFVFAAVAVWNWYLWGNKGG